MLGYFNRFRHTMHMSEVTSVVADDRGDTPSASVWQVAASRYLYTSRWYNLKQDDVILPSGQAITYTWVEHPGYALVVPLLDDGRVVMERIYRHTLKRTLLECPSGGCDGDTPEAAARRELEEETGYLAEGMTHLGRYFASSGIADEQFDIYLATGLSLTGKVCHEATEQIAIELIPLDALRASVLCGEIEDGPTSLAILLAAARMANSVRASCK